MTDGALGIGLLRDDKVTLSAEQGVPAGEGETTVELTLTLGDGVRALMIRNLAGGDQRSAGIIERIECAVARPSPR